MTTLMKAIVLDGPGDPDVLQLREVPRPIPQLGWVLIQIKSFGLNRSELHFRRGMGSFGSFPRIPGLEATGVVVEAPGGEFEPGTQVAAIMGGMGRTIDGGYAEYVSVPGELVIPFHSDLGWDVLGALPEMVQTASGSLWVGVDAKPGDTILIRGGSSSIGLAATALAKHAGIKVISTTRNPAKVAQLEAAGATHVVIDNGEIAAQVRELMPEGVAGAIELVGTNTLADTLKATATHGTVCFTGMLSDQWTIPDFYPMDYIPNGVRLTAYSGGYNDLAPEALQEIIDAVAAGEISFPIGKVYRLEEIVQAHEDMESGAVTGKVVVVNS
ncbi:zinc-binding alcohol dehydrogenase family protein [Corynebacterium callunae]|uniref:zinc-binding alcohol dehydrogenase family protein n=1 Tax=Corynebacterium callunae TaxID=1721 RepID=UPI001FFE4BE2|nr:zinc-binding alcohol dehydrogenase family protein [Corynebacterium callunae]MCK2201586.1 zinc-binding alcohol dehydrogenase family protein [Corynebacterium callunae]